MADVVSPWVVLISSRPVSTLLP